MKKEKITVKETVVDITSTTPEGFGVCSVQGLVVFVEGAIEGETHRIHIDHVGSNMAFAHSVEMMLASPDRVDPLCPYCSDCGGCTLLHISYEKQLDIKRRVVYDALTRIGGFDSLTVFNTLGMDTPFEYRNKASFPASSIDNLVGFYKKGTHTVCGVEKCAVTFPEAMYVLKAVRSAHKQGCLPYYNEKKRTGLLRHVVVRKSMLTGGVMVTLVLSRLLFADEKANLDRAIKMIDAIECVETVCININKTAGKRILSNETHTVTGTGRLMDMLCGLVFEISPESFFQINPVQTQALYSKAIEYADITNDKAVLDLYCGIGTISLLAAQNARSVVGVELSDEAIKDAKKNAKTNEITNCEFICRDAAEYMNELSENAKNIPDVVIMDPPRKGCDGVVLEALRKLAPEKIVYVSCNPATLARDIKILCAEGLYRLECVQPVDMFCHTAHVETVALLSRQKVDEHIYFDVNVQDLPKTARTTATYPEIKAYVKDKYGLNVTSLNIAQVKEKHGFEKRENYNKGKDGHRVPNCPPEKEKAIEDAFKHFGML